MCSTLAKTSHSWDLPVFQAEKLQLKLAEHRSILRAALIPRARLCLMGWEYSPSVPRLCCCCHLFPGHGKQGKAGAAGKSGIASLNSDITVPTLPYLLKAAIQQLLPSAVLVCVVCQARTPAHTRRVWAHTGASLQRALLTAGTGAASWQTQTWLHEIATHQHRQGLTPKRSAR